MSDISERVPQIGDFAVLRVVAIESVGAFLSWGHDKDLFLPFAEQTRKLQVGQEVAVHIYHDKADRPTASMRLERFTSPTGANTQPIHYQLGEQVELLVFAETDLGYKAIINGRHLGILYKNEVFQELRYGDELPGYIRKVRDDGKIDLILQPFGNRGADDLGQRILDMLHDNNGFLPLTEKTAPEEISRLFGVSKKKYKMALGGIYKKRLVRISDDGIYLITPETK